MEWYLPDDISRLLFTEYSVGNFIPYVFVDSTDTEIEKGFLKQLESLFILAQSVRRGFCFVSKEPSYFSQDHYICGLIFGSTLIIVNPSGRTRHKNFYDILKTAKSNYSATHGKPLSIYINETVFQTDGDSCGPICVEIARHLMKADGEEILRMIDKEKAQTPARKRCEAQVKGRKCKKAAGIGNPQCFIHSKFHTPRAEAEESSEFIYTHFLQTLKLESPANLRAIHEKEVQLEFFKEEEELIRTAILSYITKEVPLTDVVEKFERLSTNSYV